MAADEVIKIDTTPAAKSLSDLRKELKDTQKELSNTKEGTKDYLAALEKLGAIKDDIGDLKDTIGALNPEGKIQAFTNVAGKLAGGFQAAAGAAALFGAESEDLQKSLLKVQAATAFAQGIQSVVGLGDAFKVLAVVIESNPIFLVAAALIAVVVAAKSFEEQEIKTVESIDAFNESLKKQTSALNDNEQALEANNKIRLELLKQRGATIKQLDQEEITQNAQKLARLKQQEFEAIQARQIQEQDNNLTDYDLTTQYGKDLQKLNQDKLTALSDQEQSAVKKRKDFEIGFQVQLAEIKTSEVTNDKELYKKLLEKQKEYRAQRYKDIQSAEADNAALQESIVKTNADLAQKESDDAVEAAKKTIAEKQSAEDIERDYLEQSQKKRILEARVNDEQAAKDEIQLNQQTANAKQAIAVQSVTALKSISDVYFQDQLNSAAKGSAAELAIKKKQFEINKAFAIADAIINGYKGVVAALGSAPPPYNFILAAITGIAAAANVVKIANTKFDSGSTAASTSVSAPSTPNVSAPQAPTVQQQTQLNANGTVKMNTDPTRVYVSGAEIMQVTDNTNRIKLQSRY